jgi:CRP-like cAMP-binding protein
MPKRDSPRDDTGDRLTQHNKLLKALPTAEYQQLRPHLESLLLPAKQVLYDDRQPIEYIYFLQSGTASLLTRMEDGSYIEVVMVGNESVIGVPIFLGVEQLNWQACWQSLPGEALRIRSDRFKQIAQTTTVLPILLRRYTQTLLNQITYLAVCHHQHSIKEFYCRWLLTAQDRVGSDEFFLTQDFLAQLLGVRRASISEIAASLREAGLVEYHRGKMRILHRPGLEKNVCECYTKLKKEYTLLHKAYQQFHRGHKAAGIV